MFLAISGISGSGKSTIGLQLSKDLGLKYIDIDSFYISNKPYITLSNNVTVKNWDCLEALDITNLKLKIKEEASKGLILVGFTLRDDLFDEVKPHCHIHLSSGKTKDEIIQRCIKSRQQSKSLNLDELNVREVVYPFYMETCTKSTINHIIEVYHNNERKSIKDIISEILKNDLNFEL